MALPLLPLAVISLTGTAGLVALVGWDLRKTIKTRTDCHCRMKKAGFGDAFCTKEGKSWNRHHQRTSQIVKCALQETAKSIAVEVVNAGAVQGKYILPEYDGRLLSNARERLGKPLTAKQKEKVRDLLRNEVRRLQNYRNYR